MNLQARKASAQALLISSLLLSLAACGDKAPAVPPPPAAAAGELATPLAADSATWTPEAMEDLLAPIALYPDPVLAQVLVASTNPQEVLDAGNWLVANPDLKGKPLDTAAEAAGFTLTMRSVMQFPDVVDKLCLNMPWTEELGQAYVNDQQGVMDAVQRLRAQAQSVGTLKSSPQMKVSTEKAPTGDIIKLDPPASTPMSVPQYDPVAVYAPPGGAVVTAAPGTTVVVNPTTVVPAATTTTTTTTTKDEGHSTESMVATGLLSFGAGLLVADLFDDDDYYGNMWHGPMPYYPPYPYRPAYGGGYYPGNAYNRPNNYVRGGNTVIVNNNNNYYNRYKSPDQIRQNRASPKSPITAARPNRPELNQLNAKAAQGPARRAPSSSEALNGRGGYAGNDPKVKQTMDRHASQGAAREQQRVNNPPKVQGTYAGAKPGATVPGRDPARQTQAVKAAPKVQGSYAGAKPERTNPATAAARPASASRDAARPAQAARPTPANHPNADRGRAVSDAGPTAAQRPQQASRPASQPVSRPSPAPQPNRSAMSGGGGGRADNAASARGHQSMPSGGAAKARAKPKRR
jgi:predicted small lipoprotein YifL